MSIFRKIASLFSSGIGEEGNAYWVRVRCDRCGETIQTRVDLHNDLSIQYGEENSEDTYYCRKVLIGNKRCFQKIEVELWFNGYHRLTEKKIQGGTFITEEDNLEHAT